MGTRKLVEQQIERLEASGAAERLIAPLKQQLAAMKNGQAPEQEVFAGAITRPKPVPQDNPPNPDHDDLNQWSEELAESINITFEETDDSISSSFSIKGKLAGKRVQELTEILSRHGLIVDSSTDDSSKLHVHADGFDSFRLIVDEVGGVICDRNSPVVNELDHRTSLAVLYAAQELLSDLSGIEHQAYLLEQLRELGWMGYVCHGSRVFIDLPEPEYVASAKVVGPEVQCDDDLSDLTETDRQSVVSGLEQLRRDVDRVHQARLNKTPRHISDYIDDYRNAAIL